MKTGVEDTWRAKVERKLTAAERKELERKMTEQRRAREAEEARDNAEAAKRAEAIWAESTPAPVDHPYLAKKGISPCGARVSRGDLVITLKDADSKLWSLQFIKPQKDPDTGRDKTYLAGGRKQGCYFTIGKPLPGAPITILICEGFATGASIHAATDLPVAVAFDSGNLRPVAVELRKKYPDAQIVICADNDCWKNPQKNPGLEAAREAANTVRAAVAIPDFSGIQLGSAQPTDFNDLAHLPGGLPRVAEIIETALMQRTSNEVEKEEVPPPREEEFDPVDLNELEPDPLPIMPIADRDQEWPFRPLGCGVDQNYYYLKAHLNQVVALSPSQHTKTHLLHLAPLLFWEREFPGKQATNWDSAANSLMRSCEARGIFSPTQIRGRGTWHDDGRIILHLGDRVLTESGFVKPREVRSRFVYEESPRLDLDMSNPLGAREAVDLFELMKLIPWSERDARLASGWIMCAHIGGALKWRPHIWVTGSKGSGKSWVMSDIVQPALGDNMKFVVAESSEAGIRQELGNDALPILFDEAEGEDRRASDRIQRVLALARQASCETGAKIVKGTVGGKALTFQIRSCFALSSIKPSLHQEADRSRFCVLDVDHTRYSNRFSELKEAVIRVLTPEYSRRLFARAVRLAGVIRGNSAAFGEAVAQTLKDRRAGDQYGALLAGNYALHSDRPITVDAAKAWLEQQQWTAEVKEEVQGMSDEQKCLERLMQTRVRLSGGKEANIGILVDVALAGEFEHELPADIRSQAIGCVEARFVLTTYGIKVDTPTRTIDVARRHPELHRIFADTPYAHDWGTVLKRLPGAVNIDPTSFGSRTAKSRAVRLVL
jgi:putative DNA primase/helicase